MRKILIDSSVYLSIFLKDSEFEAAKKLVEPYLDDSNCIIYIPTIIIAEVINSLTRTYADEEFINSFISTILCSPRYKIIETDLIFHFKEIRNNASKVTLKTSDLIIFSLAKLYQIDKIIAIDKQLSNKKL